MATWNMMMMQDPASMMCMYMMTTHNILMEVMIFLAMSIMVLMMFLYNNKSTNRMMTQSSSLEIVWTLLPMMILIYMASPSLQLLYMLEETSPPSMTVKSIGHQWYWSYEYPDFKISFDSYMMMNPNNIKQFRLLETDTRLNLPFKIHTRILTSSTDVIHSWAIPSLGMKMDAIPGRINQMNLYPTLMGMFFGQCSEICGMNHSFMPIVTEIISVPVFTSWIKYINLKM